MTFIYISYFIYLYNYFMIVPSYLYDLLNKTLFLIDRKKFVRKMFARIFQSINKRKKKNIRRVLGHRD